MVDAAHYRGLAKQHREQAAAATDPKVAEQLLRFAADYAALAALLEEGGPTPTFTGPMEQQPVQQQQQKKKDGET